MPAGRPTDYDPAFCAVVRDKMGEGYSKTAVAGFLRISRQTLLNWANAHPEFMDAVKDGEAGRTFKLEADLLEAKDGPHVTSRIFALKNAAPEEWSDTQRVIGPGPDGEHKHKIEADDAFARIVQRLDGSAAGSAGSPDGEG